MENDDEEEGRAGGRRDRRARSGSFNVDLGDGHNSDDEDEGEGDVGANNNNDLVPLEDADFNVLADDDDDDDNDGIEADGNDDQRQQRQPQPQVTSNAASHATRRTPRSDDYGCEVLTFGRADHCALGAPQASGGVREKRGNNNVDAEDGFSSGSTSYKPRRVETFALGELRRGWSTSGGDARRGATCSSDGDGFEGVDSPAVSIAASTHHTLVATRSGQLYSFGYGKSGRLGTGDEHHRPLPTRILGPLAKRIVASIAAAANHSLCSTSDGWVYAWGSNGFGQLGYSTSSKEQDANSNSRLSPRRVEGELRQSFVVSVAAGDRHSVALTRTGEVYCWGDNRSGQLAVYSSSSVVASGSGSPSSQVSTNST